MKRISIILIIAGLLLCGSGIMLALDTSEDKEEVFDYAITDKEREDLENYLSNKYGDKFEVISRDSRYCLIQDENSISGTAEDPNCEKKEIINDIFRVKDKNNLEFFVKKVTLDKDITLLPSLINTFSAGFYDNYVIFYLNDKYSSELLEKFDFLDKISSERIYYGLGIEDELPLKNNKSYNIYQTLGRDVQNLFNKNNSFEAFLDKANELGFSFEIGLYIKADMNITPSNFQSIVKAFVDNDCYNFTHGIKGSNIIIEFNDKRYLKIENGYLATLYEYSDNVFESNSKKLYDNSIVLNNDPFSEDGIKLDLFLEKKESSFNF